MFLTIFRNKHSRLGFTPTLPRGYSKIRPIYLDLQATTPVDPRVLDSMMPFFLQRWGNSSSKSHFYGWESEDAVEKARKRIADLIGAEKQEIVFTSGATESGNLAVKGLSRFHKNKKNHIVTLQTEHKCILGSCRDLEKEGFKVTYLGVKENGLVDLKELENAIRPETVLVSIMAVNNEIGVIQPLEEIGKLCKKKGAYFHTDAAQAAGKIPLNVNKLNVDLMSVSGHKMYGPKGIGALFVRRRPRVKLLPLFSGGGQERGLRCGTLPTALIVGLGEAASICQEEMEYDRERIKRLSDRLMEGIKKNISHVIINGENTYPGCVNVSFLYVEGESIIMKLKNISVSSGSACTSGSLEPSYVLRALGGDSDASHSSIRFGIGRFTTEEEIDYCISQLAKGIKELRELSPLWEMVQKGIDLKQIKWKA